MSSLHSRTRLAAFKLAEQARATTRRALVRLLPSEAQHVFALTLLIGLVCGLVAVGFHLSIRLMEHLFIERALAAPGRTWIAWTILSPALGGLVAGIVLTKLPGARGSGVPQVKAAYALHGGVISFRDSVAKFVLCALQIGTGGSLGREGPTVQICAGTASSLGRATWLPRKAIRRLTPVGVAAGIAAAFNAPIAAVTFTIEEIVGTLDQTVLSGVVVAAALAAVIERGVLGVHPVIEVAQSYGLEHASSLPFYGVLGVAAGIVSVVFTDGFLNVRSAFRRLKIVPSWIQPALGGAVAGLLCVAAKGLVHQGGIAGGGYQTLGAALDGTLAIEALALLCAGKLVATVASYSSGGAGGIFAPSLFVGAMLGGLGGYLDRFALGHHGSELGSFALVGMGAVFAGVIRAPITSVLIIFEMTGGYGLVLPLMIANMTAYGLARRWRPVPIYDALLLQDGIHLPHRAGADHPLAGLTVANAMTTPVMTLRADRSLRTARDEATGWSFTNAAVVDGHDRYVGSIPLASFARANDATLGDRTVADVMTHAETIPADASLARAATRMHEASARQLFVVDARDPRHLRGVIAMSDIVRAHAEAAAQKRQEPSSPELALPASTTAGQMDDPLSRERVQMLATPASPVDRATPLAELLPLLVSARDGVVPLAAARREDHGVLLLDHVREMWNDQPLAKMLVAADVVHPCAPVRRDDALTDALRLMDEAHVDALPVVEDVADGPPVAVITRAEIGRFILSHYARRRLDVVKVP